MTRSTRADRAVQCTGKLRYRNKPAARRAIRQLRSVPAEARTLVEDDTAGRLTPYRCPWCDAWHIGHSTATITPEWLRATKDDPDT